MVSKASPWLSLSTYLKCSLNEPTNFELLFCKTKKKYRTKNTLLTGASPVFLYTDQTNDCNRIYPSGWFWFPTLCRLVRWLFDQVFFYVKSKKDQTAACSEGSEPHWLISWARSTTTKQYLLFRYMDISLSLSVRSITAFGAGQVK